MRLWASAIASGSPERSPKATASSPHRSACAYRPSLTRPMPYRVASWEHIDNASGSSDALEQSHPAGEPSQRLREVAQALLDPGLLQQQPGLAQRLAAGVPQGLAVGGGRLLRQTEEEPHVAQRLKGRGQLLRRRLGAAPDSTAQPR